MASDQQYQGFSGVDFRGAQGLSFGSSTNNSTNTSNHYGAPDQADELAMLLGELDRRISEHQGKLEGVDQLREAVEAIKGQISSGHPSKGLIKTLLLGMTSAASGVEALVRTIDRVRVALGL